MSAAPKAHSRRDARFAISLLALGAFYLGLTRVLAHAGADHGLVSPDGRVDVSMVALTFAVLGLRLVLLFVAAPIAVYRAVRRVFSASR